MIAPITADLPPVLLPHMAADSQLHRDVRDGWIHWTVVSPSARLAVQTWEPEAPAPRPPVEPEQRKDFAGLPPHTLAMDSHTETVAAWCAMAGLVAKVVGAWVWAEDNIANREVGGGKDALDAALKAAGFGWSRRRQSWFHKCGVEPKGPRMNGKLGRYHGTAYVEDYRPETFDARPEWLQQKEHRKDLRKLARARKAGR